MRDADNVFTWAHLKAELHVAEAQDASSKRPKNQTLGTVQASISRLLLCVSRGDAEQ